MRRPVVAVMLAVLVSCAGCNGLSGGNTAGDATVTVTPAAVPPPGLPGVDGGEVADAERLAGAHEAALDATTYELVRTRTVRVVSTNRTLNSVRMWMTVAASGRAYNLSRVEESVAGYGSGGASTARVDVYYRNGTALQRTVGDGGTRVWRTTYAGSDGPVSDRSRAPFVEQALSAFRPSVVERTRVDDGWRYRLRADGLAASGRLRTIPTVGNATDAVLTATVDARGVVRVLRYDYRATYRGQAIDVTQTLRVTPTDAPVDRPPWAAGDEATGRR
jgi:hypothetical protein